MTPETIIYLFIAGGVGIVFKIVWDWLIGLKSPNGMREICKHRMEMFDDEISRMYERLERIEEKLEITLDRIDKKIDEKIDLLIKMVTQGKS